MIKKKQSFSPFPVVQVILVFLLPWPGFSCLQHLVLISEEKRKKTPSTSLPPQKSS